MVRENSILALFENSQPNYLDTSLGLATMVFNLSSMRPWGSSRVLGSRTVQPSTGASAVTSDIGVSHKISLIKIFKLRRFLKKFKRIREKNARIKEKEFCFFKNKMY